MLDVHLITLTIVMLQIARVMGYIGLIGPAIARLNRSPDLALELRGQWPIRVLFIPFLGAIAFHARASRSSTRPPQP